MSGIHSCIKINTTEKRDALVALLNGDVEMIESLLMQNNDKPLPVFDVAWGEHYYYFDSLILKKNRKIRTDVIVGPDFVDASP